MMYVFISFISCLYFQFQGVVYHYLGSERLSEKTLLDAIKVDPLDHHSW